MRYPFVLLAIAVAFTGMTLAGCDKIVTASAGPKKQPKNLLSMKIDFPTAFTASLEGWVLRLEEVTFRGRQHTGLRIFVNNPTATAKTPTSDHTYLGSFSPGHFDKNFVSTSDFVVDLSNVREPTKKLLIDASTIEITCVPLVRDQKSDAAVTVGKIRLDYLKSPK